MEGNLVATAASTKHSILYYDASVCTAQTVYGLAGLAKEGSFLCYNIIHCLEEKVVCLISPPNPFSLILNLWSIRPYGPSGHMHVVSRATVICKRGNCTESFSAVSTSANVHLYSTATFCAAIQCALDSVTTLLQ